jgi:hypothetical protein
LAKLAVALACVAGATAALEARQARTEGATSTVTVVQDRATVWRRNPSIVLAVVPKGTVLRALSQDGTWYEVHVPEALSAMPGGATGFILASQIELAPGSPAPPLREPERQGGRREAIEAGGAPAPAQTAPTPVPAKRRPGFGIRGFGSFDYMWFAAEDSFEAILGEASHPLFGGGVDVIIANRIQASVSASRIRKTGQRVFVSDGEVFKLGLDDTVTVTPLVFTAAYRLPEFDRVIPYVGGGIGRYAFEEESEFAEAGENVDERFTSYHVLGGAEYAIAKWLFTAFEVQYATVPDSLGAPGVSSEFGEKDLGGFSLRVKVSVGR